LKNYFLRLLFFIIYYIYIKFKKLCFITKVTQIFFYIYIFLQKKNDINVVFYKNKINKIPGQPFFFVFFLCFLQKNDKCVKNKKVV